MRFTIVTLMLALVFAGCIPIKPTQRISFNAPDTYPEGVAYNQASDLFYVSSQRTAAIGKVTRSGEYSVFFQDSSLKSSYGMKVHPDGKRLFVCVGDANFSKYTSPDTRKKMGRLISIDLATGNKISDTDLSGLLPGKHFVNDLTFDSANNVYVTDSYAHAIYKISPDGKASVYISDKILETEGFGVNGIVYHPNGYLLVDNTNTGSIYKIRMGTTPVVQKVKIDQFFLGADGLLLNKDNLLTVVVNGGNDKIFQLKSDDEWTSAKLHATTLLANRFTYPATATFAKEEIWVMNAKSNELLDSNAIPAKIFAIQLAKPIPVPVKK